MRGLMLRVLGLVVATLAAPAARADRAIVDLPPGSGPSVGINATIPMVVVTGTELMVKPLEDRRAKVVVRILEAVAVGDNRYRYKLSYNGLEPGRYDLKDYLERKDGGPMLTVPAIPVAIRSVLGPGQVEPHALAATPSAFRSYYRWIMFLLALLWFAGLVWLAFGRRRRQETGEATPVPPPTLADRLRPLVERAMAGTAAPGEHAELERILIATWRHRLGLEALSPGAAVAAIRADPAAGQLLRQLEAWLHRPPGEAGPVDLAALLAPYRQVAAGGPIPEGQIA